MSTWTETEITRRFNICSPIIQGTVWSRGIDPLARRDRVERGWSGFIWRK